MKSRLVEREREVAAPSTTKRRLSAREKNDENKAMHDLSARIKQLTKLILTSQTIEDAKGDEVGVVFLVGIFLFRTADGKTFGVIVETSKSVQIGL